MVSVWTGTSNKRLDEILRIQAGSSGEKLSGDSKYLSQGTQHYSACVILYESATYVATRACGLLVSYKSSIFASDSTKNGWRQPLLNPLAKLAECTPLHVNCGDPAGTEHYNNGNNI